MREREGLVARIRQIRRTAAAQAGPSQQSAQPAGDGEDPGAVRLLETRIAHLEQLVEALQDSVHRESERQQRRITELEARVQPAALGRALSQDSRERGL